MALFLVFLTSFAVRVLRAVILSRANLVVENVSLGQQVATQLHFLNSGVCMPLNMEIEPVRSKNRIVCRKRVADDMFDE